MTKTPGQLRTAAATAARKRSRLERLAPDFRAAGWTVAPPETIAAIKADADRIEDSLDRDDAPSTAAQYAQAEAIRATLDRLQNDGSQP